MSVACVNCEHADLKSSGSMARHGFTRCSRKDDWHFQVLAKPQNCPLFKAASAERAAQRHAWMQSRGLLP